MPNWESSLTLHASSAETVSGTGTTIDLQARDRLLRQTLDVTGASGTLVVSLQASADGTTAWRTFATFSAATAVGSEKITAVSPERYVRLLWTITGGTPSFTFSVSGTRGLCFANLEHFHSFGLPAAATVKTDPSLIAEALAAATEFASGILGQSFDLPLIAWGLDAAQATCKIAAYDVLAVRGFGPDAKDVNVKARYDDAISWFNSIASGRRKPIGMTFKKAEEVDESFVEICDTTRPRWR